LSKNTTIEHGNQNISGYNDACALFITVVVLLGMTFGGGENEFADKVVAAAETIWA
jgi:hypothetical protein